MTNNHHHHIVADRAALIRGWFESRGGICVWPSVNLSNPGASWTTPLRNEDGTPAQKPTWQAGNEPRRILDPAEVVVDVPRLVRRFRVAVRHGRSNPLLIKLTDASSRKLRAAEEKAGEGSWHVFDYEAQDALIYVADREVPLPEWRD